jgi:hypothetical protein
MTQSNLDGTRVTSETLRNLKPGEAVVYHKGYLGLAPGVADVASTALELSKQGKVHLTQRRLGPPTLKGQVDWKMGAGPGFEYIATGAIA